MRIFWSQSKHHFLCKSPFPSSDIFQFWNILISKDLENWKLKSTGNVDVGKVLKYMSALCARLPFHFEGSQVEVAVANSPKIILHQNLSSPRILNKCTFSTAEVLQIIWFLQRLSDPICEHPFKWVNPPSPVHCWKKVQVFVNWTLEDKRAISSWTHPNMYWIHYNEISFYRYHDSRALGKLDQSKGRQRAFGMKAAERANIWHISNTTSAASVLSGRVESTMR